MTLSFSSFNIREETRTRLYGNSSNHLFTLRVPLTDVGEIFITGLSQENADLNLLSGQETVKRPKRGHGADCVYPLTTRARCVTCGLSVS